MTNSGSQEFKGVQTKDYVIKYRYRTMRYFCELVSSEMSNGRRDSPCYNARPNGMLDVWIVATDERDLTLGGSDLGGVGNESRLAKGSWRSNVGVGESRESWNGFSMAFVEPWPEEDGSGTLAGAWAVLGLVYG